MVCVDIRWGEVEKLLSEALDGSDLDYSAVEKLRECWEKSWKVQTFLKYFGDLSIAWEVSRAALLAEENEDSSSSSSAVLAAIPDMAPALRNAWDTLRTRAAEKYALEEAYSFICNVSPVDLVIMLFRLDGRVFDFLNNRTLVDLTNVLGTNAPKGAKASKILRKLMLSRTLSRVYREFYYDAVPRYVIWLGGINGQKNLEFIVDGILTLVSLVIQAYTAKDNNKIKVVLSVDPVDILTASIGTTRWYSCFNIMEGCYRTAPLAILGDDTTCIAYAYETTTVKHGLILPVKLFRQWVAFVPDQHSAVFGRRYPGTRDAIEKTIRSITASVLARDAGLPEDAPVNWIKRAGGNYKYSTSDWVYYDEPTAAITLKVPEVRVDIVHADIGTDTIPCLTCGDMRDDGSTDALRCEYCNGTVYCVACGDSLHEEDVEWYDGDPYCRDCFENRYGYCSACHEARPHEDLYYIEDVGEDVCFSCLEYSSDFASCNECGDWHYVSYLVDTKDGRQLCEYCIDRYYTECEHCGEYVPNDDVYITLDRSAVCSDCLREHYTECADCGEYVPNDEAVEVDGDCYCAECAKAYVA